MIYIQNETTKNPITLTGYEAGICYGSDTSDPEKNYKRGLECLKANHGRTLEFSQLYAVIDEYSAKVIREFYTHIGGCPTRLQASTRYINYEKDHFTFVTPKTIKANEEALKIYNDIMDYIANGVKALSELGIPKEDASYPLPFAMKTKIVWRTNLRQLIDMEQTRLCNRALWEFRDIMHELNKQLRCYSSEWNTLMDMFSQPKCEVLGYCPEKFGCGRKLGKQ